MRIKSGARRIKTYEGVPPAEFVLAERMRRAASLLVGGSSNVKAVARDCGFDDPNYFAKAFRRRFGASPTEFRTTGMYSDQRGETGRLTTSINQLEPDGASR